MKKIHFPCLRCGRCCRMFAVSVTQAELEILNDDLNSELNLPRFCTYCDTVAPASENPICPKCGAQMRKYLFKDDNERCSYLSENASGNAICRIYSYRPQECRRFLCIFVPPHLRIQ